jgi:hypothetical protein
LILGNSFTKVEGFSPFKISATCLMYSCKQKEKMRKFIVLEIHFPIYLDA